MQGKDRGEGQAAQWVADSTQRDREGKKARSWKAGTCHGHHRECQRELLQSRMSVRVWGGHPLATFPWALADSGADPQWHARPSQSTPEPQTQAGASLRSAALHTTTGSTTNTGRRTQRRRRPVRSLPVLFPGQSTSAELRASSRGRERARIPGNQKTREGTLGGRRGEALLNTMVRTLFSLPRPTPTWLLRSDPETRQTHSKTVAEPRL